MKNLVMVALVASTFIGLSACKKGGDDEKQKKAIEMCKVADEGLREVKDDTGTDTMMTLIEGAMQFCSAACDGKDSTSCATLETHVSKLCGVSPGVCTKLCETAKGDSLKKTTCAHAEKK